MNVSVRMKSEVKLKLVGTIQFLQTVSEELGKIEQRDIKRWRKNSRNETRLGNGME